MRKAKAIGIPVRSSRTMPPKSKLMMEYHSTSYPPLPGRNKPLPCHSEELDRKKKTPDGYDDKHCRLGNCNGSHICHIGGNTLIGVSDSKIEHYQAGEAPYYKHDGIKIISSCIAEVTVNNVSRDVAAFSE